MGIFDDMQKNNQKQLEASKQAEAAANAKASEYANLTAQVKSLEATTNNLNRTMQGFNSQSVQQTIQAITEELNCLKTAIKAIQGDIEQTGSIAKKNISKAANAGINWKQAGATALLITGFFSVIQCGIQYHFAPSVDYAKRIMWNIQYPGEGNYIGIFDDEDKVKQKYENQKKYEDMENFKAKHAQQQQE